jgi:hypothetical protein
MLRAVVGLAVLSAACAQAPAQIATVRWLPSGIVYSTSTFGGPNDLILTSPDGSARTTLDHSTDRSPFWIRQVILP